MKIVLAIATGGALIAGAYLFEKFAQRANKGLTWGEQIYGQQSRETLGYDVDILGNKIQHWWDDIK